MNALGGQKLWGELHQAATLSPSDQLMFFTFWLNQVREELGCVSCYRKLTWFLGMWQPDFGEGFKLWGFCLHDFVNKELGKPFFHPEVTLDPLTRRGIIR